MLNNRNVIFKLVPDTAAEGEQTHSGLQNGSAMLTGFGLAHMKFHKQMKTPMSEMLSARSITAQLVVEAPTVELSV